MNERSKDVTEHMTNLLKLEFQKLKYPYLISLMIAILYSGLIIIPFQSGYLYSYNIEVWEESGELFTMLFPLFAVVPTCWLMYYERKNGFLNYTVTRVSKKKYVMTKWLVSSLGGSLIVFIVSITGLILCLYVIPDVTPQGTDHALNKFAGDYFVHHPLLYGLILSLWRMVIAFFIATLGFVLSLYINNIFIVLTGPFVYSIVENFILAILGVPYFRLVTSFDPSSLQASAITVQRLLVGPLLLVLFISGLFWYFHFFKKETIFSR